MENDFLKTHVDFAIDKADLGDDVFNSWTGKIREDERLSALVIEDGVSPSVSGTVPVPVFMEALKSLSRAKKGCKDSDPFCVCVCYWIFDENRAGYGPDFDAVNTMGYRNDAFDSSFISGVLTDGTWIVGDRGICCVERETAGKSMLINPFLPLARALETACGPEKAAEIFKEQSRGALCEIEGKILRQPMPLN